MAVILKAKKHLYPMVYWLLGDSIGGTNYTVPNAYYDINRYSYVVEMMWGGVLVS